MPKISNPLTMAAKNNSRSPQDKAKIEPKHRLQPVQINRRQLLQPLLQRIQR